MLSRPAPDAVPGAPATIARSESMRMKVPFEGGFWVTLSAPIAGVVEWVHSLKVPAVSVVTEVNGNGPNCVLGVEFLDWVKKIEEQQRAQAQAPDAAGG